MILFPRASFNTKVPDFAFEQEVEAAKAAGFKIGLVDTDQGSYVHANIPALYRGWIIKPGQYEDLVTAEPNIIIRFADYMNSYSFPEWYSQVYPSTPKSVWFAGAASIFMSGDEFSNQLIIDSVRSGLGTSQIDSSTVPLIVKDFVKSRKHEWLDACFIPDTRDEKNFRRVVTNFINGQGDDLVGGLVFREFVNLKSIGTHPKSGLPLINEHRFFVFKGQIFYSAPYWDAAFYGLANVPDKKIIIDLVSRIKSKFFAIDVAEKQNGGWIVIEVNDGGTAGIPEGGNALDFYQALRELF